VPQRVRWWLLAFLVAHAFVTEMIQQFVPLRTGSLRDACINLIGLAIGVALTWRDWRR
jgi:VanZ family protein